MHYLRHLRNPRVLAMLAVAVALLITVTYFLPGATPWVPTGRLVIAVRAVPYTETDRTLGFGLDDMTLTTGDDTTEVNILARRVQLDPKSEAVTVILDTSARTGGYSGFGFTLSSPELRNPWQGSAVPESVSLTHDTVAFPIAYQVVEGETTVILLSFETVQALHEKDGTKEYLPVVQAETRHGGSVGVDESGAIRIEGGTISASATYGMDWDGRMRYNFRAHTPDEPVAEVPPVVPEIVPAQPATTTDLSATTTATTTTDATTTSSE